MATTFKTPDVYVEEVPMFPPSVAEVGTAIPAFVGHTKTARKFTDNDLRLKPVKIRSFAEYLRYFGGPNEDAISVTLAKDDTSPAGYVLSGYSVGAPPAGGGGGAAPAAGSDATLPPPVPSFLLYWAVRLFFDNGGSQCYVVSAGGYESQIEAGDKSKGLVGGLAALELEDEPTLLVTPDAVKLGYADYQTVASAMLAQCSKLQDRFAILDTWNGDKELDSEPETAAGAKKNVIVANREAWTGDLKYGAAYYPFVVTTFSNVIADNKKNVTVKTGSGAGSTKTLDQIATTDDRLLNFVQATIRDHYITMPPSGAVAGVYAAVDGSRGVWKAPANVALTSVLAPAVKLDSALQEDLNVDATTGKSINAIRSFTGKGTLVWGARTLAGNDNEWRYISVRRFFNMVEESVKKSTAWAVFEPNDANLWVKVRGMIENYLIDKWREGALAGATPKDAFYVKCGLGSTMIPQDILEGRLIVEIGMATVRPAEFIVLKFSHKLQTS